jgi:hypothetical protein
VALSPEAIREEKEKAMRGSAPRWPTAVVTAWLALLLLALMPSAAGALSFDRTTYPTGSSPWSVATADFNGDTDPDLAVANLNSDDVSILLGGPGGTFTGPTNIPAGANPIGVATGDFNGDSDPDLAVANNVGRTVSILLGGAGGTFTGPTGYTAGNGPEAVAVGDFNGDSDPDLAVANRYSANVSVLLGSAGGTFLPRTNYPAGADSLGLATGDFNGDSDPDLAVTSHHDPPNVWILPGDTGGTFGAATQISAGASPVGIAVGELSGDSDPDLAVANFLGGSVSVLLGTAGLGFTGPADYGTHAGPHAVAIGDIDGDTDPDLAVANASGGNVSILLGAAGSSFVDAGDYAVAPGARSVVLGDFDLDGAADLAFATNNGAVVLLAVDVPSVSVGDLARTEGDSGETDFTFTVTSSGPSSEPFSVDYRTVDGTALAPSDYTAVSPQTLSFGPFESSKTVTVKVKGDVAVEAHEDFSVVLSGPVGALIADGAGTGTIVDDDLGFVRPRGASPLRVSLVPAYEPCTAPDETHGPPLSFGSCAPPQQTSSQLTVGTADANGPAANSVGSVRLSAVVGTPPTPPDEADMRVATSITDVRRSAGLADYVGEVQVVLTARLTDRVGVQGDEPLTTQDFGFRVAVPCVETAATTIGATCALTTTADAVVPGSVPEGRRSLWALDGVEVFDGGPDADADTLGDNTLFATQGIFVP